MRILFVLRTGIHLTIHTVGQVYGSWTFILQQQLPKFCQSGGVRSYSLIAMMGPFRSTCLRQWNRTSSSRSNSTLTERKTPWGGAAAVGVGVAVSALYLFAPPTPLEQEDHADKRQHCQRRRHNLSLENILRVEVNTSSCDPVEREIVFPTGHTEVERFIQTLEYNRCLLPDYVRRWETRDDATRSVDKTTWPRAIPSAWEIPALELDLKFCQKSPSYAEKASACHKHKFRIGSYYVMQKESPEGQIKGYKMIKELAEQGHPDGMCLYGIILNEGLVEGVDINPEEAVVWWRRCVDSHRHIKATYELGAAMYTGEGVAENPELAVKLFRRIAHLGHAGAAYMLSECLLDGVGITRDRSDALEWLVTAAELGHRLAQNRVISILRQDYAKLDSEDFKAQDSRLEEGWSTGKLGDDMQKAMIERRHTIGGGSRNPFVATRRKTKVLESRNKVGVVP